MAVTVDAVSTSIHFSAGSTGGNATATHVVSASATGVLLCYEAGLDSSSDALITGFSTLTLGGKAFTHLGSALKHSGTDAQTAGFVDLYYMTAASTGSGLPSGSSTLSVTPTFTGGGAKYFGLFWSVSVLGHDGNAPTLITPTNGQLVSSLTLTATGAASGLNLGIAGNGSTTPGVTTGTSQANATGSAFTAIDNARVLSNAGNGSLVWSTDAGDWSAATGALFVAAGAATKALPFEPTRMNPLMMRRR